jgi:bifunctional enzyme CysN/CysC
MNSDHGCVIWLTGISGAGKSTIAAAVMSALQHKGYSVFPIDGDDLRGGLSNDLGFAEADRIENMRRAAEVAQMASTCGLVTVVSLISPSAKGRQMVRELVRHGRFIQVYVNTPLEVAEARDVKGLYKKARAGLIKNFTAVGSNYESPTDSEITIETTQLPPDAAAQEILSFLMAKGWLR